MLNVLLDLIECWGEGRVEIFCRHVHRFCPPPLLPGYSNWKLTSLYLYSYREIRRLHKFFCVDLHLFIAFYSALFSEKTICWGWVNDAPLSCRGWSHKCILLKSANSLSWTEKCPALSIGIAHWPSYTQLNLFTMLHWHYNLSCLNQLLVFLWLSTLSLVTVEPHWVEPLGFLCTHNNYLLYTGSSRIIVKRTGTCRHENPAF